MKTNSNLSQKSSDMTPQLSLDESAQLSSDQTNSTMKFMISKSGFSVSLGKWMLLGIIFLGIIATIFLLTRGSEFCLFSVCNNGETITPIAVNFWSMAGGIAAYGLGTLLGIELLPAVAIGLGIWFLMQISLH